MRDCFEGQDQMWLSLLRTLTTSTPDWFTMKGVESALHGVGDVDSIAPTNAWPVVVSTFENWAHAQGLGPVVVCPHAPFLLHLVALSSSRPEVFELDVNARKIYFGSTLFRPDDVAPLATIDESGFRRLRTGAEGVLKLIQNGSTRDGRPRKADLTAKRVIELLASDPEGVRLFSERFGVASGALVRACEAAVQGSWDRRALVFAKSVCLLRGVREPDAVIARMRFHWQRTHCPVLRMVLLEDRRVDDPDSWLREVALTHELVR
jgi:hypothetical protein